MIRAIVTTVGNRTVTSNTTDLANVEEARERYVSWDAKYARVSRSESHAHVTYKWIDRAEGNLPGVGTHLTLIVPKALHRSL